jgi:pyruvate/2-oxoglutarate dehydrogenase complex dihydrolipoamide dehydrogenase (E3) component
VARAAGADVTVLRLGDRVLKNFEPEVVDQLTDAAEAINIFALAMKFGLTTRDLKKVLWAYPTHISDIKYMLD